MIAFHTADIKFSLRNSIAHKKFIAQQVTAYINKRDKKPASRFRLNLSFIFCTDEYLLNINRQFLNHDYYTDIITFPLENSPQGIEAEIYISIDRVLDNSTKYGSAIKKAVKVAAPFATEAFNNELDRVIFHGVLHLLGYKDKTTPQKAEMRKMEDKWLREFHKFFKG
ncbi:MAG TPA: rRNA maturation RNAse YbeY [Chitinophagales bacterium]|nr:rRNA maturation RNAse YbeY [Chitinophagales bacterium]